jgi:hypothetical protein
MFVQKDVLSSSEYIANLLVAPFVKARDIVNAKIDRVKVNNILNAIRLLAVTVLIAGFP